MSVQSNVVIHLRVISLHSPAERCGDKEAVVGLQDKQENLQAGTVRADGSLMFECEVRVKTKDGKPDFAGSYVHGTRGKRFLYICLAKQNAGKYLWIRRLKVQLNDITTGQVEKQGVLEAVIEGYRSGTVPLIGGGWQVR